MITKEYNSYSVKDLVKSLERIILLHIDGIGSRRTLCLILHQTKELHILLKMENLEIKISTLTMEQLITSLMISTISV